MKKKPETVLISDSEVVVPRQWIERLLALRTDYLECETEQEFSKAMGMAKHIRKAKQFISEPTEQ